MIRQRAHCVRCLSRRLQESLASGFVCRRITADVMRLAGTAAARADAHMTKEIDMKLSLQAALPATTTDTGRIRLGAGWRLPPAIPAKR